MSLSRIYAVFIRQIFLIKSNPTRLASIFLWIIIDVVQWGFISKYLGSLGQSNFSYITVILGAIILWEFTSRIQQGMMTAFLEDIWSQNFINFFASPLKISEYVTGLVISSIATSMMGFLAMIIIAGLAFGYNIFKLGFYLLPFIIILFIFGMAMGLFISGSIFRLGPSAEWLGWPIPLVLSIFAGVYYPVSTLPYAMQIISKVIPASYVFDSMRSLITTETFSISLAANLIIGTVTALIYLVLMYFYFLSVYRHNLKSGSIARFSAEV